MSTDIEYYAENHNLDTYKFTITGKDAPALAVLKEQIREHNKRIRERARSRGEFSPDWNKNWTSLLRVKLQARGPRAIHARADFGPNRARAYDCSLPHRYATHFDVYVLQDSSGNWSLKREIETGQSPGVQRKIDKLKFEAMKLEWEARGVRVA